MPLPFRRLRTARRRSTARGSAESCDARVWGELLDELPDEDLGEHPDDALEAYRPGGRPRCEEAEYLEIVGRAVGRIGRGR
ncbi:hypothetical protein [Streptomyces sp. CNQ085]|uniref:hypothetical protein n=1 Tax=Streptomyces sp. CNQ085 TaxID=2886944 RepID=UPI001F507C98|nr:hypothetical protein [Streptomyces sp. CNQ085]MCI0384868.1 hypothetical protein [Streptomyces sp. CNQ085]